MERDKDSLHSYEEQSKFPSRLAMKCLCLPLILALAPAAVQPQLLKAFMGLFPNIFFGPDGRGPFGFGGVRSQHGRPPQTGPFIDDGTLEPVATGRDELFPTDCGRNPHDGTGKLCFPDAVLCSTSE